MPFVCVSELSNKNSSKQIIIKINWIQQNAHKNTQYIHISSYLSTLASTLAKFKFTPAGTSTKVFKVVVLFFYVWFFHQYWEVTQKVTCAACTLSWK